MHCILSRVIVRNRNVLNYIYDSQWNITEIIHRVVRADKSFNEVRIEREMSLRYRGKYLFSLMLTEKKSRRLHFLTLIINESSFFSSFSLVVSLPQLLEKKN